MAVTGYMSSSVSGNIKGMLLHGNPEFMSGGDCSALGRTSVMGLDMLTWRANILKMSSAFSN